MNMDQDYQNLLTVADKAYDDLTLVAWLGSSQAYEQGRHVP